MYVYSRKNSWNNIIKHIFHQTSSQSAINTRNINVYIVMKVFKSSLEGNKMIFYLLWVNYEFKIPHNETYWSNKDPPRVNLCNFKVESKTSHHYRARSFFLLVYYQGEFWRISVEWTFGLWKNSKNPTTAIFLSLLLFVCLPRHLANVWKSFLAFGFLAGLHS